MGGPAEPIKGGSRQGQPPQSGAVFSQVMSQIGSRKLEGHSIPGCHAFSLQGSQPLPAGRNRFAPCTVDMQLEPLCLSATHPTGYTS